MTIKKITGFKSPDGLVEIGIDNNNTVHMRLDRIPYSRHEYDQQFNPEVIQGAILVESRFWRGQQRTAEEIEYNLDNLEYKLVQWPYFRNRR